MAEASFPKPVSVGPREWGEEILLMLSPEKYMMKLIVMKEGKAGGLQYHRQKDEAGWMAYGQMKVTYDDGTGSLVERVVGPGDAFHFPCGAVHKALALTDCAYIECSTPHFNDRVHVESYYGLDGEEGGLPSTEPGEIELR